MKRKQQSKIFNQQYHTKRKLFINMSQSESECNSIYYGDDSDEEEDVKLAVAGADVENTVEIAKMCLENSKRAEMKYVGGIIDNGLNLRDYQRIDKYQQDVSKAAEEDRMCDPSSMKTYVTENLVRSRDARLGLCQMADVCLSIVDLFCLCKIDIFSGVKKDGGISRCIWQLMGR